MLSPALMLARLNGNTPATGRRDTLPERGWDWEEILVDGRLHCVGYRREAVLIPEPLPVYAAA